MSYFTREPRLCRPIFTSLSSSNAAFSHWVAENGYHLLHDQAGTSWDLKLDLEQLPHPEDLIKPLYRLHIRLSSQIDQENLIKSGALQSNTDSRLLDRIGTDQVPMALNAGLLEATSMDGLRADFANYIMKLRDDLKTKKFSILKRRLVGEWVDRKSLFGHTHQMLPNAKIALEV